MEELINECYDANERRQQQQRVAHLNDRINSYSNAKTSLLQALLLERERQASDEAEKRELGRGVARATRN